VHKTLSERTSGIIFKVIMLVLSASILYPFIYCLAYSFSDSQAVMIKNITLLPIKFTLDNYRMALADSSIYLAFFVSVFRAVGGALWAVFVTSLAAYAISKPDLPGRKVLNILFIIPMYITGGLIPFYLLVHDLNLFNNILIYILPHGFYAFNMLIMMTYFKTVPASLEESASIDGAGFFRVYLHIILPLSIPVLVVIGMFTAVWQWNSWFDVVLYITRPELYPLQRVLQVMLEQSQISATSIMAGGLNGGARQVSPESLRMATLMITTLPIVIVYPFVQKYFVRGIMVGAVKA
jgi:putative aldouronate transport system permease protein